MKTMEQEIERVRNIMERVEPLMQRYLAQVIDREGKNVGLSVASNLATTLMAYSLVMVAMQEGSADGFMDIMIKEIIDKFEFTKAKIAATNAVMKAMGPRYGGDTCQTLH